MQVTRQLVGERLVTQHPAKILDGPARRIAAAALAPGAALGQGRISSRTPGILALGAVTWWSTGRSGPWGSLGRRAPEGHGLGVTLLIARPLSMTARTGFISMAPVLAGIDVLGGWGQAGHAVPGRCACRRLRPATTAAAPMPAPARRPAPTWMIWSPLLGSEAGGPRTTEEVPPGFESGSGGLIALAAGPGTGTRLRRPRWRRRRG
jgi:hypothetical protein